MTIDLNAIAARLGSMRGKYKNEPRGSLRCVLFEDMPKLIKIAKAAEALLPHLPYFEDPQFGALKYSSHVQAVHALHAALEAKP